MLKKIAIGFGAFIVLGIIVSAAGGSDTSTSNNASNSSNDSGNSEQATGESTTIGLNQAARDGKFEFTVTDFECGATTLGTNEFLQEDAQGQFCVMDVTVKNIGDEAQTFFSSDQKIINSEDQEYSNDTSAEFAINDNDVWLNEINPGNTAMGQVVFDVPADATIVKAELHDSAFSGGVEVSLQ